MEFPVDKKIEEVEVLRWYAGVPIGTNPVILFEMAKGLGLLWCLTVAAVVCLQCFFGGELTEVQLRGAIGIGNHLVFGAAFVFFLVAFLLFQNRYVVLCRLNEKEVYCESMSRGWGPLSESFHWRPFRVERPVVSRRTARKIVPWSCLEEAYPWKGTRTILLRKGRATVLRLYCPDENSFEQALKFVGARIVRRKDTPGITKN